MRRYARSAFARDCTRAERDALVQQGFPAVDTHGSLLDANVAPAATRAEEERKHTKKKRREKRASRGATEASRPSSLPRADSTSMVFSPLVRCDDDDFGTTETRDEGHAARLPAEVFGGRGDHPHSDAWLDSDPEGDDAAWERGSDDETRRAFETRDAILSPVAGPRRPRRGVPAGRGGETRRVRCDVGEKFDERSTHPARRATDVESGKKPPTYDRKVARLARDAADRIALVMTTATATVQRSMCDEDIGCYITHERVARLASPECPPEPFRTSLARFRTSLARSVYKSARRFSRRPVEPSSHRRVRPQHVPR